MKRIEHEVSARNAAEIVSTNPASGSASAKSAPALKDESLFIGDVVWCFFPYAHEQQLRHPALLLRTAKDAKGRTVLIVAGGTSVFRKDRKQRTSNEDDVHLWEIDCEFEETKLREATKFSISTAVALPLTDDVLVPPEGYSAPGIGHLDLECKKFRVRLMHAAEELGGMEAVIESAVSRYNKMRR